MIKMNDMVKCARCKKALIAEEFGDHICTPEWKGCKTILIDYHTTSKDEKGREIILAMGMDGIMYSLVLDNKPTEPIPFKPSDETLQGDDPTNTGQNP